ncbi:hypothetical protein Poly30_50650 [Planctomycetes bacterium Poly30]|uniref:Tll0287-like domain-containing protein n=1 Tax=Saltatorellus ferox TaxID=2528018 RepID=A0A518EZJ1_9BACT|nr:hypothetical protein Poly30_50650 [Planctomycetes bacterium Poly30]
MPAPQSSRASALPSFAFAQNLTITLNLAITVSLALTACGGDGSAPASTTEWHSIERGKLSQPQTALLGRFEAARNELASSLFSELTGAIQASGHAEAISVCQERAPAIAKAVSTKNDLRIGRTAARLRNPSNAAPTWAADRLASEPDEYLFARGDGELRALFPILIAPACLACHGKEDDLGEGVAEALSIRYSADQATGFSAGDLRGWFWVENDAN